MNIILTDMANLSVFVIPVVPPDVSIESAGTSTETETEEHKLLVIKNEALKKISWSSMFPVNKNYNFTKSAALKNGWAYVTFLELMKKYRLPIRVIITTKHKVPVYNSLMEIEKFIYGEDKGGDVAYSIELKEFYEKFLTFIDRDIEVAKYVKNYNKKQWAKKQLEKFGLLKTTL